MPNETTEDAPSPLPVWLSIPIILVCLAGGGWIIHWYVMTDPISHEAKILGDAPAQAQWQLNQRNNGGPRNNVGQGPNRPRVVVQRRGIQYVQNTGAMDIRTEKAHAVFTITNGKATLHNVFYINVNFLPPDALQKILKAKALIPNQKRTEAMKLDVHQVNQLRTLTTTVPMALTEDDKTTLIGGAQTYATDPNSRNTLETKLLQQLDDIADRSIDATKQEAVNRASQIDAIITPDMWQQDAAAAGAGK